MIIDCGVHPMPKSDDELRRYLPAAWRTAPFGHPFGRQYVLPVDDGHELGTTEGTQDFPGSDPHLARRRLFDEMGIDVAILLPLTRGLHADPRQDAAVAEATNSWLAETWLSADGGDTRFRGTIRVAPSHPGAAVREIERWAGDQRFVQVGAPLMSQELYGNQQFFPIWEAAAAAGLPVVLHDDPRSGIELPPSPAGYFAHFIEYTSLVPASAAAQLASFASEGVFDRLPSFMLVFADGGIDFFHSLLWRWEKDWRAGRHQTPWMQHRPSEYLRDRVRFVTRRDDGPEDPVAFADAMDLAGAGHLLLYGSDYASWNLYDARVALAEIPVDIRDAVMFQNALRLFGERLALSEIGNHDTANV